MLWNSGWHGVAITETMCVRDPGYHGMSIEQEGYVSYEFKASMV